jgi:hypothetical protein
MPLFAYRSTAADAHAMNASRAGPGVGIGDPLELVPPPGYAALPYDSCIQGAVPAAEMPSTVESSHSRT